MQFHVPLTSNAEYVDQFDKIAEAFLNHTVLEVRPSGSTPFQDDVEKYFRVAEIEFYLNDFQGHLDSFVHGDPL